MKTITAYQCEYCEKVYANRDSARHHVRKCYFNPETHSCATCAFLNLESVEIAKGHTTEFQVCLMNEDIRLRNLRTKCSLYHQSEFDEEFMFKTNIPAHSFNRALAMERLAGQIDWFRQQHQTRELELQRAIEEMDEEA